MPVHLLSDNAYFKQATFGFVPGPYVGLFSDIASLHQIASGGNVVYYPAYNTIIEKEQPGNTYIDVETKIRVPYNVPQVTNYVPQLVLGVTYAELLQLENDVPELSLVNNAQGISQIIINNVEFDIEV